MTKSTLLRRALIADAAISGASGLLMLFGATALGPLLNVPAELLRSAGISLVPFTAFVAWLATREQLPRIPVWAVIAMNIAWVVASFGLLLVDGIDPNRVGVTFIVAQAIAVAAFAEIQYVGLRNV